MSYFFEAGAVDENGKLLVESKIALNKVGHALHWLNPTFKKHTFSEKVKETCFQLGLVDPVIVQSMYIFKNPGVGSEGMDQHQHSHFQNHSYDSGWQCCFVLVFLDPFRQISIQYLEQL